MFNTKKNKDMLFSMPDWIQNPIMGAIIGIVLVFLILWLAIKVGNEFKLGLTIGQPEPERDIVWIMGQGKINSTPDVATIEMGMVTEAKELSEAQKMNTQSINKLINYLKESNVEDKDIQTADFSIYPLYDYLEKDRVLTAYQVRQNLRVKIRNLDKIGTVIGQATEYGANQVGGINFTIDNPENLKQQAQLKAIDNAKAKVLVLAQEAGINIGHIISFTESEIPGNNPSPYFAKEAMADMGTAPTIEIGQQQIIANMMVGFEVMN